MRQACGACGGCEDDRVMTHVLNLLSAAVLIYAAVTGGGLAVSRLLERMART
jgi:hypothetical protein